MSEHAAHIRTAVPTPGRAGRRDVRHGMGTALPAGPVRGPGKGERDVHRGSAGTDRGAGSGRAVAPHHPGPGRYGIASITASAAGLGSAVILVGHIHGWW